MTKSLADQTPQYQLGATSEDAHNVAKDPIPGPGDIANTLTNQQWQFPRSSPDASMSRDHSTPYG
jgi:hypothetical protein